MNTEVQFTTAGKRKWIWLHEDNEDLEDLPVQSFSPNAAQVLYFGWRSMITSPSMQ